MWKLLLLLPIGYLAICVALFLAQGKLLFPVGMVSGAGPLPPSAKRLIVRNEGEQLHGVHIPPRAPGAERLTVLSFGGNAWNAEAPRSISTMFTRKPTSWPSTIGAIGRAPALRARRHCSPTHP